MSIMSFIAVPKVGCKDELAKQILKFSECELVESTNQDLLVVLVETSEQKTEASLVDKLSALSAMQSFNLVYANSAEMI